MSYTVEIPCAQDGQEHTVVLTAKSRDVFLDAAKDPGITAMQGEALVAALLALSKGKISTVERFKDDKRNDGPNGERAYQEFNDSGTLTYAARYKEDKLNDGPNGEAAVENFNDSGTLFYAERYKDGERNDGLNGEPAIQKFNDSGTLTYAARYNDNKLVEELYAAGIAAYLAAQERAAKSSAIQSAFGTRLRPVGPS